MSIQEISGDLDFPSRSVFGKYFRSISKPNLTKYCYSVPGDFDGRRLLLNVSGRGIYICGYK